MGVPFRNHFPKINSIKFTRIVMNRTSSIHICFFCPFLSNIPLSNGKNSSKIYTTMLLHGLKWIGQRINWNWNVCFMYPDHWSSTQDILDFRPTHFVNRKQDRIKVFTTSNIYAMIAPMLFKLNLCSAMYGCLQQLFI